MLIFCFIDKIEGTVPILPRGLHQFPFKFHLPESSLPCSFESKPGYIRYYIKVEISWISLYYNSRLIMENENKYIYLEEFVFVPWAQAYTFLND